MADGVNAGAAGRPRPVGARSRIGSLDVVRGFALLGILGPNILAFGWLQSVFAEPAVFGMALEYSGGGEEHAAANEVSVRVIHVLFHGKMMFLFSLLFGAGVLMYARKFDVGDDPSRRGKLSRGAGLWYQRCAWLLVIGLLHAVGLWYGDILVWYALAGLGMVWWVRRLRTATLLAVGGALYVVGMLMLTALMIMGLVFGESSGTSMLGDIPGEVAAYRGSYLDALKARVVTLLFMYIVMIPFGFFWMCSGIMMLGMGLTKSGVLTGERSDRFYARLAAAGLALGLSLTLVVIALLGLLEGAWGGFLFMGVGQLVGIPTSLGYASVLILLVRRGWLRPLTVALSAVGRMALSNYLLQTILCTTFFYGHGLGYFARVQFPGLWLVVLAVWGVNVVFSLVWMRFFLFGPAEWAWRSLTYMRPQPIRRAPVGDGGAAPA